MNNLKDPKIANRESWLKVFVIGGFSALIAWKLLSAPIAFNLSDFKFTDLLNLLLAFFAIALSVAFYFKATDTSNQFYDNTYKFTKEFSEILGRIEAGFGERLKHLDEGYTGLRDRFDEIPFDAQKAGKEIKEEEKEIKKKEEERNQLLENLAVRAKLQEEEKRALFDQLKSKDDELSHARRELVMLQNKLTEAQYRESLIENLPKEIVVFFRNYFVARLGSEYTHKASPTTLRKMFLEAKLGMPAEIFQRFKKYGLANEEGDLTSRGIELTRELGFIHSK